MGLQSPVADYADFARDLVRRDGSGIIISHGIAAHLAHHGECNVIAIHLAIRNRGINHSNAPHTANGVKATEVTVSYELNPVLTPSKDFEKAKQEVFAAVPDLKPASELPAPKKRGRKPKDPSPDNGQPIRDDGITDADIANAGKPAPVVDEAANQKEAQEFVESVTSFTEEQAKDAGLPPPPDPLPSKEQLNEFIGRARKLVEPGVDIKSLGDFTLGLGGKTASKYLTVGDWTKAFEKLDAAKAEGKLKELVKGVPEPEKEF